MTLWPTFILQVTVIPWHTCIPSQAPRVTPSPPRALSPPPSRHSAAALQLNLYDHIYIYIWYNILYIYIYLHLYQIYIFVYLYILYIYISQHVWIPTSFLSAFNFASTLYSWSLHLFCADLVTLFCQEYWKPLEGLLPLHFSHRRNCVELIFAKSVRKSHTWAMVASDWKVDETLAQWYALAFKLSSFSPVTMLPEHSIWSVGSTFISFECPFLVLRHAWIEA